jgi:hypothetical protein
VQVEELEDILEAVKQRDESTESVYGQLHEALEALKARNAPERPVLLRSTQASIKHGRFKVNSFQRNVQTVDHYVFVPYGYGDALDPEEAAAQQAQQLAEQHGKQQLPDAPAAQEGQPATPERSQPSGQQPDLPAGELEQQHGSPQHEQQPDEAEEEEDLPETLNAELCIVKIEYLWLLRWKGEEYRFATGQLTECDPVDGCGHVTGYCDGSHGRRTLLPSLLTSKNVPAAKRYPYALWLSQIHCTCISTTDGQLFRPAVKTTLRG